MTTITRERLEWLSNISGRDDIEDIGGDEIRELARIALASLEAEQRRNPVLVYADSYRDMAKQGVESIPVWSVITDLERNIAPLYAAPPAPVVPDVFGYVLCNHGVPDTDFVFADRDSAEGTAEHLNDSDTHDVWTVGPICCAAVLNQEKGNG
ncbi:hypothetical protein I5403_11885 [Citrobacter farmeri]|uniref:hypothetical protein n=1 Tax=Citrobacter farmeri TaxID=67824 RepID=UPI0019210040|nr:hypothetical protein [Citrobacter farmeri]MBJ8746020.1 hypothetical protein [Citrobacter farmeri]MBJ8759271.1 hypothetical protein [Citrobacter farmeri]